MALTESKMLELGTYAPYFALPDTVSDQILTLNELHGQLATVIMFICNHCPYVIHVNSGIVALAHDFQDKGVQFIAISSNNVEKYPMDSPELMKSNALEVGYTFPYLYDATQEVAHAYDAACTPDFYIFDKNLKLVYRGRLDASRPNSGTPVTGEDIRKVLNNLSQNIPIDPIQYPSAGCGIKWK
jgi:peroxiredoxin